MVDFAALTLTLTLALVANGSPGTDRSTDCGTPTSDAALQSCAVGSWAVSGLRRVGTNPLHLDNEHVRGGMKLDADGGFFVFITYRVHQAASPDIRALAGTLPQQAVGSGHFLISNGILEYTILAHGGPPFSAGATFLREIRFETPDTMILAVTETPGTEWQVIWRRLPTS